MDQQHLEYLFDQHDSNRITEAEKAELYDFLSDFQNKEGVFDFFEASLRKTAEDTAQDKDKWGPVIEKILASPQIPLYRKTGGKVRKFRLLRYAAAASILLLLSTGAYFIFNNKKAKQIAKTEIPQQPYKNDVAPGGNKAILTLANGQKIILDSAANGTISQQGNIKVIKLDSGQLAYSAAGSPLGAGGEVLFNTITTPRGGQYQVVLADGSKVWLNAASSLKYPTAFTGRERNVELTGEGYFEIAHDASKPFRVSVNGIDVQVLGTHFNINAYDDESVIRTTLLEGSVKISKGSTSKVIKPGEQASFSPSEGGGFKVQTVDLDEPVAWKNGNFQFERTGLTAIMRQISRWYDVDIVYENKKEQHFSGIVSRNINVSEVLKILESNGANFEIEGRKIIVK